jgi:hypothetical protein
MSLNDTELLHTLVKYLTIYPMFFDRLSTYTHNLSNIYFFQYPYSLNTFMLFNDTVPTTFNTCLNYYR